MCVELVKGVDFQENIYFWESVILNFKLQKVEFQNNNEIHF